MNAITDYLVIAFIGIYFIQGCYKGLIRSIMGPISFAVGLAAGYLYYLKTGDLLICILITILAPIAIQILVIILSKLLKDNDDKKNDVNLISRVLGGGFSVLWSGGWLLMTLVGAGMIPEGMPMIEPVRKDIVSSKSYEWSDSLITPYLPKSMNLKGMTDILKNPDKLKSVEKTQEFQGIINHTKIKDLLEDEETQEDLKEQNIFKLLANPKMKEILKDKDLVDQFLSLQQKMLNAAGDEISPEKKKSSGPKIINIKPQP